MSQGVSKFARRIAHLIVFPPDEEPILSHSSFSSVEPLEALENIAELTRKRIHTIIEEETLTGARYLYLNRDLQVISKPSKSNPETKTMGDDPPFERSLCIKENSIEKQGVERRV